MKLDLLKKTAIVLAALILVVIGLFLVFSSRNPVQVISGYLQNDINVLVFTILMTILPLFGAPISIFLLLVGMKFGVTGGIMITGAIIIFHLLATYYMVHSFFRPWVVEALQKFNMKIPQLPQRGKKRLGFIFMIFPGLPYTVKNYLFALTEMPLRPYMLISWTAQFGLSIPFVILGKGVMQMDPIILITAVAILLLSIAGQNYIRKRYKNI